MKISHKLPAGVFIQHRIPFLPFARWTGIALFIFLSGCGGPHYFTGPSTHKKHVKRGYNKKYTIKEKGYVPQTHYGYSAVGIASYYGAGDGFHGRKTSTGERFNKDGLTCAHKTLPLPSVVRVTNLKNGRSLKLRVCDRGPFVKGRIIDVSEKAAILLGFKREGITRVRVECLAGESLHLAHRYDPKSISPYSVSGGNSVTYLASAAPSKTALNPRPASRLAVAPLKGSYIQAGSYMDPKSARLQAVKLNKQLSKPCKAYEYKTQGRKRYRVIMGPLLKPQEGSVMLAQLRKKGLRDAFLIAK